MKPRKHFHVEIIKARDCVLMTSRLPIHPTNITTTTAATESNPLRRWQTLGREWEDGTSTV